MRTTIDAAGRLVIPKRLREALGLAAGSEVDIAIDGVGIRVDPVAGGTLVERDGFLVIDGGGPTIDVDDVQALRDADQR